MPRKKKLVEEEVKEKKKSPNSNLKTLGYFYGHGSRKEARARVRLYEKGGPMVVNERSIEEYFPGEVSKTYYLMPFKLTDTMGKYSATIKVEGSGKSGQLGAVVHGLSRALLSVNSDFRPVLKKAGLLTRDPRAKERRKYGLAQKARKGKQSPRR